MRTLPAVSFLLCSSGCAHGIAIQKIDGDTYHITCPELSLDRCLAETANNTCDRRAYFVARGISEVQQRGRSDAPDVSLSSEAIVRCAPGQSFGDQAKELMAPTPGDRAKPAAAPSPPQAQLPAATPAAPQAPASVCAPGSTQACVGAGACRGGQACKADGSGYEACDCGSPVPVPATGSDSP
jgi:hypothetical protein